MNRAETCIKYVRGSLLTKHIFYTCFYRANARYESFGGALPPNDEYMVADIHEINYE
jgi:hypothetical protein